jgi:hypothetical protein
VAEWQRVMGAREFKRWIRYFTWELNHANVDRDYLAQIACEVRRSYLKDPRKANLGDFRLKYETEEKAPMAPAVRLQNSKNYWLGLVNFFWGTKQTPPAKEG